MTTGALYQVVLLGRQDERAEQIQSLICARVKDLGLSSDVITFVSEPDANSGMIDRRLPTIGLFFGYDFCAQENHPFVANLIDDSDVVVPIVTDLQSVNHEIPDSLRHINAIEATLPDHNFDRITSLVLEGFRLLRRERRLFISYKRDDSREAANQIYDALDQRGFDVFIDTRTVPPGIDFQGELWHRMADSDVVILIDTPGFRASRWTVAELTQANATNVQILHLLWPGQPEDPESALSYFHRLEGADFSKFSDDGRPVKLCSAAITAICNHAEKLRARAIAARHRYLIDSFCDSARDHGFVPNVQPQRWISIDLPNGTQLAAVPNVGLPNSSRFNEVFDAISESHGATGGTWLLYDQRGVLSSWVNHLSWLDQFLPVKSIGMTRVAGALKEIAA